MKTYTINVHYDVCISVEVEANSEVSALDSAEILASDIDLNDGEALYIGAFVTDVEDFDIRDKIKDYVKKRNGFALVDDLNIMIQDGDGEGEFQILALKLEDDKLYLIMDKPYDDRWDFDDLTDEDVYNIYTYTSLCHN